MAEGVVGAKTTEVAGCLVVEPTDAETYVDVAARSGSDLFIWSEDDATAAISVSLRGTYSEAVPSADIPAGGVVRFGLPDIGEGETVRARITLPTDTSSLLCRESQPLP